MLTRPEPESLNPLPECRLWHDERRHTPSLGCMACPERSLCGGLSIAGAAFDCTDLCCSEPESCDKVCRCNPDFSDRVREVDGFALEAMSRTPILAPPSLPRVVPVLFHGNRRTGGLAYAVVALPFFRVLDRHGGTPRFATRQALLAAFGIAPGTPIVLTGIDRDAPLERWWGLGEARRRAAIRALLAVGAVLATTPNYSLFVDVPRWDDLHAMKRIAIVHREFLDEAP